MPKYQMLITKTLSTLIEIEGENEKNAQDNYEADPDKYLEKAEVNMSENWNCDEWIDHFDSLEEIT